MSIFKRSSENTQQATATPPASAAPGVVPPPAAPIYSTRPAETGTHADVGGAASVSEKVRMAREAQERVKDKVRLAVQRARSSIPSARAMARPVQQAAAVIPRSAPRRSCGTVTYAQAGLLNLAWRWQESGAPIRAIHAYMELLARYPDTAAAEAAVADLVDLSEKLTAEGQFHTALAIYDQLEYLT